MKTENQGGVAVAERRADEEKLIPSPNLTPAAVAAKPAGGRAALHLAGRTLWHFPGRFGMARVLGPRYSLRCMIFHDVSDTESSLTRGLGVTTTRASFEAALTFLTRHYTPVSLQDVLGESDGRRLPPRPVLVTFDDAYASVVEYAAPLCRKFGVPAVFFVNAAFLDNQQLALDNLACHVANGSGMGAINAAVRAADGAERLELRSLMEVFSRFLPAVSLPAREVFRDALVQLAGIRERDLAEKHGLYLSSQQLRDLEVFNFEIGNHTYSHVNCRALSGKDFGAEINRNKAILEAVSGRPVRSFSVPYGSSADLNAELAAHLERGGHEAVFLAESRANPPRSDKFRLDRISVKACSDASLFSEIEVLPRLRTVRNWLTDNRRASRLEKVQLNSMPDLGYEVEVDGSSPAEWSAMLDLFQDANLYQTWSYGAVRWGSKSLSHLVLKRNGNVLAMAQLRIIRPANLKFGVAYLRWGPLCHRRGEGLDPEIVLRMARALQEEYVSKRRLLLRVLPNAFVGSPRAEVFQSAFPGFTGEPHTSPYRTFILDLTPPLEELRRNLDKKWRNALSRAEKNGLKIIAGSGNEEYRSFCQMYNQMRKRKGFETSVDVEEFERIQKDLPENHRMRIMICEQEGVPVAGIVASAMGDSASYLLGATSDGGLNAKGAYLLQWTLIQWLKENSFKWYDLGGIDPEGNPGVYHFKNGLSGADVSHMSPLIACNSVVTSAIVTAGEAAYRALQGCMSKLRRARAFAQAAI